jgi:hypothetical protein
MDANTYQSYVQADGSIIQLDKALYGCLQSGKLWFELLSQFLKDNGYVQNLSDICVFNKLGDSGKQITLCLYVDDILVTGEDEDIKHYFVQILKERFGQVTLHEGTVLSYLGMTLDFSTEGCIGLSMQKYVDDLLELYKPRKTARTPASPELFNVDNESEKLDRHRREEFHSRVAKLLYLAKRVRPDILTAVASLSTRVSCSTKQDWSKLERVMRYISKYPHLGIKIS